MNFTEEQVAFRDGIRRMVERHVAPIAAEIDETDRVPTAMVFVPCVDGISHHPAEDADPADAALAAEIILNAVEALT